MLMSKNGSNLIRYQSAFISDNEVNKLIREIKRSQKVNYLEELDEIIKNNDENFDSLSDEDEELISKSINLIKSSNKASSSWLSRFLAPTPESNQIKPPGTGFLDFWSRGQKVIKSSFLGLAFSNSGAEARK